MSQETQPIRVIKPRSLAEQNQGTPTPAQQLAALRQVQDQAEHRVKLGVQLFKAAEAHTTRQQTLIEQTKSQQQQIHDQMQRDVASSLQSYDQWLATFDQRFTEALQSLEDKVEALHDNWASTTDRIQTLILRAEALLGQARQKVNGLHSPAGQSNKAASPLPAKPMASKPIVTSDIGQIAPGIAPDPYRSGAPSTASPSKSKQTHPPVTSRPSQPITSQQSAASNASGLQPDPVPDNSLSPEGPQVPQVNYRAILDKLLNKTNHKLNNQ